VISVVIGRSNFPDLATAPLRAPAVNFARRWCRKWRSDIGCRGRCAAVERGGIVHAKEIVEQFFVAEAGRIEHNFNRLRMAGAAGANLLVGWVRSFAAAVTDGCLMNAGILRMISSIPQKQPPARIAVSWSESSPNRPSRKDEVLAIAGLVHFFHGNDFSEAELMQKRKPPFVGRPSSNTWPRWESAIFERTSVRTNAEGESFSRRPGAFDGLGEAGPARAGIKLVQRAECGSPDTTST